MKANKTIVNMAGGELSPSMHGRVDLPTFQRSMERIENFIITPQGGARFRPGTQFVKNTRQNQTAVFIPFQFNDTQSYLIEATHKRFRFYRDNAAILETAATITGITAANPPVVTTSAAHGYSTDDEVYISSVSGMTRVNGRYFRITVLSATTFSLQDIDGANIDASAYAAYTSGGSVARVYEITTIYEEVDLPYLEYAQNADTMYIAHQNYPPGKLTRSGHTSWTLNNAYVRTADPFVGSTDLMNAATQANPVQVTTTAAHGLSVGDVIAITGVVGMTQLNGNYYKVGTVPTSTTLTLQTLAGVNVNGTAYTAYSSGGTITASDKFPRAVIFIDTARLVFGGTKTNPETIWASKAPTTGTTAYDNFTTGAGATDALIFTLAPVHGKVDSIQWIANTAKFIAVGTFGSVRRLYGATEAEPISPTSLTAKSVNNIGCSLSLPISIGSDLFYIQRGDRIVRSLGYAINLDGYVTIDRNLVANHLSVRPFSGLSGLKHLLQQQGQPDVIWAIRNDGILNGLVFNSQEEISGWFRAWLGGVHRNTYSVDVNNAKVLWAGRMPRSSGDEQLWLVVERHINSATVRSVEYLNDEPVYPVRADFYTGDEDSDDADFTNVLFEIQKDAVHLDMAVSYDGSAYGTSAGATLTPGSTAVGTGVTFTASAAVFTSSMVGRQLWKKYNNDGSGGGRATITGYTSSTVVTCEIISAFDSTSAIPAGSWFLTTNNPTGLEHMNGQTLNVVADGGPHNDCAVSTGGITLDYQASKIHIGYKYTGILKTLNVDVGGVTGSAQAKNRNLIKAAIRFLNALGVKFGTSIYDTARIVFRSTADMLNRPTPPFTGIKEQTYLDGWESDAKHAIILQENPLPCTISSMDLFVETVDEG